MSRRLADDFGVELNLSDIVQQFRQTIAAAGSTPPDDIVADGKLHRFATNGRRGDDAGAYILHLDGIPAGWFRDWRTGVDQTWRADIGRALTPDEQAVQQARVAAMRAKRETEEKVRHAVAAAKALALWKNAIPVPDDHPYLRRKQVTPVETLREIDAQDAAGSLGYAPQARGEALAGRLLIAPVSIGDQISTAELIDEAGRKSALAGGAKAGGFWAAQPLPDGDGNGLVLAIGEGIATVLTAREATGFAAVAALSAGNLPAVAQAMRARYPAAELLILGDLGNGIDKAREAAQLAGARLAVPAFGSGRPDGASDFNDLLVHCGQETVRQALLQHSALAEDDGVAAVSPPDIAGTEILEGDAAEGGDIDNPVDVTDVTGVHLSADADSDVTAVAVEDVTDVTMPGAVSIPEDERPCFRVFDDWTAVEGVSGKLRPGVWLFAMTRATLKEQSAPVQQWICSPLHLSAVTSDGQSNNFGRLLRFQNTLGAWREWAMPMELLSGDGDRLRAELLSMGVQIDPAAHRQLAQYLQSRTPERRMHCALQAGWCGDSFVLPDEVIGPRASAVIFQTGERGNDEYTRAGTLEGWKTGIAALAVGNPILLLALSAGFAGPLLGKCNAEGGGLHFIGESSSGKTTSLEAASSIWGGPNFRRSWRATANGMEGVAALFNDGLLVLDEISEAEPREVGAIVYALGNGRGKQRASRSGAARSIVRWRCYVLSSGERSLATAMAEGGQRAKAGQSVRLLDVPVARRHGAWDDLHGLPSGTAFSDAIKQVAATHYGHAGRAFLQRLTRDRRDFCAQLERIKALPELSADGGEGQDKRAAARFALLALAGELATEYGLTGWPEGEALQAAVEGFRLWRAGRGRGNDERRQILDQVADFIERHGDSRFSDADTEADAEAMRINRAGWWREEKAGRVYLFNAAAMREALVGFDYHRALDTLQEAGVLIAGGSERAKPQRIGRRTVRVYHIHVEKLEALRGT